MKNLTKKELYDNLISQQDSNLYLQIKIKEQAEEIAKFNGVFIPQHDYDKMLSEMSRLKAENKRMKFDLASFTSNVVMNGGIKGG